jgi:hypothetical protein
MYSNPVGGNNPRASVQCPKYGFNANTCLYFAMTRHGTSFQNKDNHITAGAPDSGATGVRARDVPALFLHPATWRTGGGVIVIIVYTFLPAGYINLTHLDDLC